jgi:peptidylprolyl isomerase
MLARLSVTAAAAAVAVLVGACGSSSTTTGNSAIQPAPSGVQTATAPAATTPTTATTPASPPVPAAISKKPTIAKPSGPAPKALVVRDLIKGAGAAAKSGQTVTANYVGVLYANGQQFDASWDGGAPITFPLGKGNVIPGWDRGLVGMRVGGRRELIIPAALAYGAAGRPPKIPPNAALIFDVDLLAAK